MLHISRSTGGSAIDQHQRKCIGLAGRFAERWGASTRFWLGIVATVGGLPFYYFGLFAESATTAFIWIGIGNAISSSYNGLAAALIQYFIKDDMRGLAGSVYLFTISIVGFGIGPPLTGWLIDHVFNSAAEPTIFSRGAVGQDL